MPHTAVPGYQPDYQPEYPQMLHDIEIGTAVSENGTAVTVDPRSSKLSLMKDRQGRVKRLGQRQSDLNPELDSTWLEACASFVSSETGKIDGDSRGSVADM
eukprot:2394130-Rhodomonas_salina.1